MKLNTEEGILPSRRFFLLTQALFCFGLAFIILWITAINPIVTFQSEDVSAELFNVIQFSVVAILFLWALFFIAKIVRSKIIFYRNRMIVHHVFKTITIYYKEIHSFTWSNTMSRFAGLIPVFKSKTCSIIHKNGHLITTLSTMDIVGLEPKIKQLEVQLEQ